MKVPISDQAHLVYAAPADFLSLAGDFRGTTLGPLVDAVQLGGTAPSVIQQSVGSNFLAALAAKGGNYNWVPTTSISSRTDEVVRPQVEASIEGSTGFLGGSRTGNILFQASFIDLKLLVVPRLTVFPL